MVLDRRLSPTRRRILLVLVLVATVALYIWPRALDIDRVVTVDEPVFLGMSANFANAVVHGELAETSQFLYPAVPIMWAGAAGILASLPNYVRDSPNQITASFPGGGEGRLKTVHEPIRAAGGDPLSVLVAIRIAKIVLQAGVFLIALWLMFRLFGLAVTVLAGAFIIFDPFLIAHDQLLHVDGVTGITAFASMLAAAYADRHSTRTSLWALAGVLAALCWLTRLTGLVLLPIILVVIADGAISHYRQRTQSGKTATLAAARAAASVIGGSVLTSILIWPALWVEPIGTIGETLGEWRRSVETPHPWGLYFMGETVEGDPGILLYVAVLLFKLTPFTMLGLAIVGLAGLFRLEAIMPSRSWRPVVILAAFVVVYSLGMAAGTRKFDRYILPDFLFFDLFAAIGIVGVARLLWATRRTVWRSVTVVVVVGLVAGQLYLAQAQRPYLLDYYNPLLGGTESAEETLMLGWGEGLDQAADYILSQPGGDTAVVRTSNHRTTMLYFLPDTVTVKPLAMKPGPERVRAWIDTDYAVTTILQWQRYPSSPMLSYLSSFEPVFTVTIDGVKFVRVYDLDTIPPPPWLFPPPLWLFDWLFEVSDAHANPPNSPV